eukprot:CAMPEP_0116906930 /NCGR_PEP_ID=MMETSP0467-20121206/12805_1 /TAXON_ID=283647 /ORGANISM="Mesodinium pulex, Strain SPMC105" /LENGTH=42 /DNA_ID= /DNA_START= /DNA_END= /DNA_ORIENTATION=
MAEETITLMQQKLETDSDIDESQRQIKRLLEENLEIWKSNLE